MISIVSRIEFLYTTHLVAGFVSPPKRLFSLVLPIDMVKVKLRKVRVKLLYFRYNTRVRMSAVNGNDGPVQEKFVSNSLFLNISKTLENNTVHYC